MFTLAPAVQAQTVASLTADPVFVEAAGEQTFAMTGAGWPANGTVALLPCDGSTNYEEAAANGAEACDTASLTIVQLTLMEIWQQISRIMYLLKDSVLVQEHWTPHMLAHSVLVWELQFFLTQVRNQQWSLSSVQQCSLVEP
ncbi:MAG: hypothetical protein CM15mP49_21110 [Actinomycetota bacterium]|nr:MAG: hypothetical protein CM15mP49_21110 [Actinomycetota bacterium]